MFSRNNRSVSRVEIHTGPTFNHGRVLRNKLSDSDFIEPNIPKFTAVVPAISWVFTLVKTAKSLKHCFPSRESANFSSTPHIVRTNSRPDLTNFSSVFPRDTKLTQVYQRLSFIDT